VTLNIEDLRSDLSAIDRQIIELVAKRQNIVGEIGRRKLSSGRATRDYEREKEVLEMARSQADALQVDPNLAEDLMTTLIRSSLTHQERARVAAEGKGDGRSALIIGGLGKMGNWFVNFFNSQGFVTTIADTNVVTGSSGFANWREAGTDYDVIVVATPMVISGQILTELADLKPHALIFDIGSLKTPLKSGLQALAEAGCKVTSLHPMYGPDTELLSGRHLVFVDVGSSVATAEAKELFAATMVEELDMGLDEHDRLIAYVLGLSHALNIAFFTALAESGEAAPKLAKLSSTTFDAQLLVSAAVAQDNPRMYFEIQHLNKFGRDPLDALHESVGRIRDAVVSGDESAFVDLMQNGRDYLATRQ
jgi:chorismate mutase/prephenate dehydrogenase